MKKKGKNTFSSIFQPYMLLLLLFSSFCYFSMEIEGVNLSDEQELKAKNHEPKGLVFNSKFWKEEF